MNFEEYQECARMTAIYPNLGSNLVYPALGLAGEAGEVCEKVKKVIRDKGGVLDDETKAALSKELGDVLWYVSNSASELGLSLAAVAQENLKKLADRRDRNRLSGSGDDR